MENSITERAKRENTAREKWKREFEEKKSKVAEEKKKIAEQKELERQATEKCLIKARKELEIYKESSEYKQIQEEKHNQYVKEYQKQRDKALFMINEYRIEYSMEIAPIWKVYSTIIKKKGVSICKNFPTWIGWQVTTENMITLDKIRMMKETRIIRFHRDGCIATDDINAMYLFGPRLNICYNNTYEYIEDVVWSYQNSIETPNYIDFYYCTSVNDPTVQLQGFLLTTRRDEMK